MMAADRLRALHWWEQARQLLTRVNVFVVAGATVVLIAYAAGHRQGEAKARTHMADSVRDVLADSSKAIEQRMASRAPVIAKAAANVDSARATYHTARTKVVIVSDTVLRVDSQYVSVPFPVVQVIQSGDSLEAAHVFRDSVTAAQLVDVTHDRDTWKARALLDEANTPKLPRFGFTTGVVTGIAIVLAVVHLLR
jgi:hypothetical protein